MKRHLFNATFYFVLITVLFYAAAKYASASDWNGSIDNFDWNNAGNWTGGIPVNGTNSAIFNLPNSTGGYTPPVFTATSNGATELIVGNTAGTLPDLTDPFNPVGGDPVTVTFNDPAANMNFSNGDRSVRVGYNAGSYGVLNIDGGTFTTNNRFHIGENAGSFGTFNMSAGSLTINGPYIAGSNGMGLINQTGGEIIVTNNIYLADQVGSKGYYRMTGGSLNVNTMEFAHRDYAEMYITGGTLTVNGDFNTGNNGNARGEMYISGGKIMFEGTTRLGRTGTGSGLLEMTAGLISIHAELQIGDQGTGTWNQSGGYTDAIESVYVARGYSGSTPTDKCSLNLSGDAIFEARDLSVGEQHIGEMVVADDALVWVQDRENQDDQGSLYIGGRNNDGNVQYGRGTVIQTGGTIIASKIHFTRYNRTTNEGTFQMQGGRLDVYGEDHSGTYTGLGFVAGTNRYTIELSDGVLAGNKWATDLIGTLVDHDADIDTNVTIEKTSVAPNWRGDLVDGPGGPGGLNIRNLSATPWTFLPIVSGVATESYTYSGTTSISAGVMDQRNTGTSAVLPNTTRLLAKSDVHPTSSATTAGTLLMNANDFTLLPSVTSLGFDGGVLQMENANVGTFPAAMPIDVKAGGGTLEPLTNDWNVAAPVTLIGGGELKLDGTTTGNQISGSVTGTGNLVKQNTSEWTVAGTNNFTGDITNNAGTLNVSGTNNITGDITNNAGTLNVSGNSTFSNLSVKGGTTNLGGNTAFVNTLVEGGDLEVTGTAANTGTTTVNSNTLNVTGTLYSGANAGTIVVADNAELIFFGAGNTGFNDGATITFNLTPLSNFTPTPAAFGQANLNLVLQGTRTDYGTAFLRTVTTQQLNSLAVAKGTAFSVAIARSGSTINGGLTVTGGISHRPT